MHLLSLSQPILRLLLICLLATSSAAAQPSLGLAEHLQEAIALNRARSWTYAQQSNGISLPVSALLIGAERMLVPYAHALERRMASVDSAPPLPDDLFVPMPDPGATVSMETDVRRPRQIVWWQFRARCMALHWRLWRSLLQGEALDQVEATLLACDTFARTFEAKHQTSVAMYRHLLASMGHVARSQGQLETNTPAVHPILMELLWGHSMLLGSSLGVDRLAQHSQERGVPILIADLPHIPWPE